MYIGQTNRKKKVLTKYKSTNMFAQFLSHFPRTFRFCPIPVPPAVVHSLYTSKPFHRSSLCSHTYSYIQMAFMFPLLVNRTMHPSIPQNLQGSTSINTDLHLFQLERDKKQIKNNTRYATFTPGLSATFSSTFRITKVHVSPHDFACREASSFSRRRHSALTCLW